MSDHLETLRKTLESIKPLTPEGRDDFLRIWSEYRVKRKDIITSAGDIEKYLANYLGINPTNFSKLMNSVRI